MVKWDDLVGQPTKVVDWRSDKPVDVEQTARRVVEGLIEDARVKGLEGVLRETNWVSLTACVCSELSAWNSRLAG